MHLQGRTLIQRCNSAVLRQRNPIRESARKQFLDEQRLPAVPAVCVAKFPSFGPADQTQSAEFKFSCPRFGINMRTTNSCIFKRSENVMKRSTFSEIGAEDAWKGIIYPSMKKAIVHTLLATMEVAETRKVNVNSLELFGLPEKRRSDDGQVIRSVVRRLPLRAHHPVPNFTLILSAPSLNICSPHLCPASCYAVAFSERVRAVRRRLHAVGRPVAVAAGDQRVSRHGAQLHREGAPLRLRHRGHHQGCVRTTLIATAKYISGCNPHK